jgi:TorA maturation chaperone TorD
MLGTDTAMASAAELLSHWWSRPMPEELAVWLSARDMETDVSTQLEGAPSGSALTAAIGDGQGLLQEYERLFVGPGPVPCPPYESYWREDVPIDVRRSLMGPCTVGLRYLYQQLGIDVLPSAGELPDYVAVEWEALSYALTSGARPVARALVADHLGRWLPRLCRAVSKETEAEFYRRLAARTLDWLGFLETGTGPIDGGSQQPG